MKTTWLHIIFVLLMLALVAFADANPDPDYPPQVPDKPVEEMKP